MVQLICRSVAKEKLRDFFAPAHLVAETGKGNKGNWYEYSQSSNS